MRKSVRHSKTNITDKKLNELKSIIQSITPKKIKPRSKKTRKYYCVGVSFDIETTSTMSQDEKHAVMYCWTFQLGRKFQISGRTWEEFLSLIELIKGTIEDGSLFIIYCHNLPYEFSFIKNLFDDWADVMAHDENHIFRVRTGNVEFRCSLALTTLSLDALGEQTGIAKLEGFDYLKKRHFDTPLTTFEWNYALRDVEIVSLYIEDLLDKYEFFENIPMTNTGWVRKDLKKACFTKENRDAYLQKYIYPSKLRKEVFELLQSAFTGGFTHSNASHTNKLLEIVGSYDFTSSYPTVMLAELYPVGAYFVLDDTYTLEKVHEMTMKRYELEQPELYVCRYAVSNITPKEGIPDYYLSTSKCEVLENFKASNGRLAMAEYIEFSGTSIDWIIFSNCYDFTHAEVLGGVGWYAEKLPRPILEKMLEYYGNKTKLKGVPNQEELYMESKGRINSLYGCCVTNPIKSSYEIENGEWIEDKPVIEDALVDYNKSRQRFLCYEWGVFITSYARFNLWTGIIECGSDYVYSDTDSVKIMDREKHEPYFEAYDESIKLKMIETCQDYKLDTELIHPKDKYGTERWLGVWDFEGTYRYFKTLGAKKYMVSDGEKVKITVAGLGKKAGTDYINRKFDNVLDAYDFFAVGMEIPPEETGKLTHSKTEPDSFPLYDYLGKRKTVNDIGGTHLEPCGYRVGTVPLFEATFRKESEILEKVLGEF